MSGLSEDPAIELLESFGYEYVPPATLDGERASPRDVVLVDRLAAAIEKLNPWLSEDNLHRAVRAVTDVAATSLLEANEKLYVTLTYGFSVKQNLGDGGALLGRTMPDYEARREELRRLGPRLAPSLS